MQEPTDNRPASERLLYRLPEERVSALVKAMAKGRRVLRVQGDLKQKAESKPGPKPSKRQTAPSKPPGRPRVARSGVFLFEGIEVFHGSPCRKAGHTIRYAKNGNCLECTRAGSHDDARGETYEGAPCKKKGHTTRYVRGGACVQCMREKGG